MSTWERTLGKSILSPAICDRCHLRGAAADFITDPDKPGLFVHRGCADQLDPWKKPARITETVAIPHPRPDRKPEVNNPGLLTNPYDAKILYDNFGNPLIP